MITIQQNQKLNLKK